MTISAQCGSAPSKSSWRWIRPVPAVEAKRHTGQVLTCELLDQSSVGAGWDT